MPNKSLVDSLSKNEDKNIGSSSGRSENSAAEPRKSNLLVQKYGGSSLSTPEQITDVAARIAKLKSQGYSLVVVVSAMGKTTDQLVELAYRVSPAPNRRELDMLLTTGERVSMALMSMALNQCGCRSISFTGSQAGVMTDDSHSNARILDIKPLRVQAELERGTVIVLAGFQGVSPTTKEVTTLGRGGSDTTAVAMAAHFKAARCEILKDVDGVYSADPHVVRDAKHLSHLHFRQLLDMTYWGAKVLHYRSVELGLLLDIPIRIALAHGEGESTLVDGEGPMFEQAGIISVNTHKDVRWLAVSHATLSEAMAVFFALLRDNNLPAPQLLDSEKTGAGWRLLITAPVETLNAIGHHSYKQPSIAYEASQLSSVTATCRGAFSSSLPEGIAAKLAERSITVHKMLFSAMSLTVVIDASARDQATQVIHEMAAV